MFSIGYFIAITILMIGTGIFLKIHVTAPKVFFQCLEDFFVSLDQLQKKPWFYFCSSLDLFIRIRILHINCEASFSVNKTNDIIWRYFLHKHRSEPFISRIESYYSSADFLRCVSFIIQYHCNTTLKQRKISRGYL